jgi:dihydrofolate reductase
MGDVVYSLSVSLDGFVADADGSIDFVHIDEEIHRAINAEQSTVGVHVYGRRMWELMAATWPTRDRDPAAPPWEVDWAHIWQAMPKVVVSHRLDRVDEPRTELVREDPATTVERLKRTTSGDIAVGGPTLVARLLERDLVDDFRLLVQPVTLGAGLRFFPEGGPVRPLQLVEERRFASGVVGLRYLRRRN